MNIEVAVLNPWISAEKEKTRITQITFEAGNKILHLTIDNRCKFAATTIETINNRTKIPGATTELYKKALKSLKQVAAMFSEPIEYSFTTDNPTLKAWARDPQKGMAIFQWRQEDISEENGRLTAKKIIYPK